MEFWHNIRAQQYGLDVLREIDMPLIMFPTNRADQTQLV